MTNSISGSLEQDLNWLTERFGDSADYYARRLEICGVGCAVVMFDGISSLESLWNIALERLSRSRKVFLCGDKLAKRILENSAIPCEPDTLTTREEIVQKITGGMAVLLLEGYPGGLVFSVQSMKYRSVGEPTGEGNVKGSQEGFTELLRVNISLIRRLVRTPDLTIEVGRLGERTRTEYALCYDRTLLPQPMLKHARKMLERVKLPGLFDSAYLVPFLREGRFHLFAPIGSTERPMAAAAKICEGKLIVLVNGSPFALLWPYFFAENFETLDDYADTALFASFVRLIKYCAFAVCIFLPGLYVMSVCFTPEILPPKMIKLMAEAQAGTPLPLMPETLLVVLLFEVIREAGLRMPTQLGHSVSLVTALIIGDTAVEAGLLSIPVIFVCALASVASYVVPALYQQTALLRIAVIFLCGLWGVQGLALSLAVLLWAMAAPDAACQYLYPIAPLRPAGLRDGLIRQSWRQLAKRPFSVKSGEGKM